MVTVCQCFCFIASRDARFDVDVDLSERALMCVPILHPFDRTQPALGLLQFASKLDRTFFSEVSATVTMSMTVS